MKRLIVNWDVLRDLFTEGSHAYRVVKDWLPPNAVLVNARYAWPNCLELLIQDESFPELKEGDAYPLLDLRCERTTAQIESNHC